jgi:O-methyltransferase
VRIFRFSNSQSRLETYEFGLTPGTMIEALPAWLRPPALLYRNAVDLAGLVLGRKFRSGDERAAWRHEIVQAISVGVDYIYEAGVEGDIAEFGTMTGTTAYVIARTVRHYDTRHRKFGPSGDRRYLPKTLHLFDSFEGLPESTAGPDVESDHVRSGTWARGSCVGLTADELRRLCARFVSAERVRTYVGWFADTLPKIPDSTRLALVHVDSDLYQSAKDVLDQVFGRGLVTEGAAVFFDDWNPNRADPKAGERRAWDEAVDEYAIQFSDWGDYGWAGKRFIVHSYRPADRR